MFGILALLTLTLTITLTPPSATSVDALYFFLESGSTPKCFIEDLPKETTVIGTFTAAKKSEHDPNRYEEDSNISIDIVVKVCQSFGTNGWMKRGVNGLDDIIMKRMDGLS
jgi:hypothetical protein